jgi:hypothetical protein
VTAFLLPPVHRNSIMRITRPLALPIIGAGLAVATAGCSGPEAGGNSVDVAAAASRAQSDIANYAAVPAQDAATPAATPTAIPMPTVRPAGTLPAIADNASPTDVVRRYTDALAAGRYGEAWALWDENGTASGMSSAAFAKSFDTYATYRATIGTPYDADAGAGQRYITVPVTATGTLKSGGPFRLEGPIVLHKAADGIESDDPHAQAWRIRSSEMKPRPASSEAPAR